MVKVFVEGELFKKVESKGKNGKTYYNFSVDVGRKFPVICGVTKAIYDEYSKGDVISLMFDQFIDYENKRNSLYMKE